MKAYAQIHVLVIKVPLDSLLSFANMVTALKSVM